MADEDFNIRVVTTADTSGLKETEAAVSGLSKAVADQLKDAGVLFDPKTNTFSTIKEDAKETAEAVKETSEASSESAVGLNEAAAASQVLSTGLSLSKGQAIALGRALTSGGFSLRALVGLMSQITPAAIGGAVAGFAISETIKGITKQTNETSKEIDAQAGKVIKLAKAWTEAANAALTAEDVQKIAAANMDVFDAIASRIQEVTNTQLTSFQTIGDELTRILTPGFAADAGIVGVYSRLNNELIKSLALQSELARQQKIYAIGVAETAQARFETLAELPIDESFAKASTALNELVKKQQDLKVDSAGYLENYNKLSIQIQAQKKVLSELLELDRQRKKEAQETADEKEKDKDFAKEQVEKASPQARAVLMNEQAAAIAREQGRDREADLLTKSAERFRASATPKQQEEIKVLEAIVIQNGILREIRDQWK